MVNKGIVIPAIQTDAMHTVRINNEVPFAVLHFLQCVPLLVRVIEFQDQSLLRPANKYDFEELRLMARNNANKKVSVPVVAAVYQTIEPNGATSFVVVPPKKIYKFNSDLQNLSIQDAVFSMAMNPAIANNNGKVAQKKNRPATPSSAAPTTTVKRKVKHVPTSRKRIKPETTKATLKKSATADVLIKTVIPEEKCAVILEPTYQVVEQEHLLDNGDITKAIQGFATGSFLSPKKSRSQVIDFECYYCVSI